MAELGDSEAIKKAAADALRNARLAKGYSQSEAAALLGTSQVNVHRWEQRKATPDIATVYKATQLYGIEPNDLFSAIEQAKRAIRPRREGE